MDKQFSTKDVEAEVRRLAKIHYDFKYTEQDFGSPDPEEEVVCSYVGARIEGGKGEPCIIGTALMNLGVTPDELVQFEGDNVVKVLSSLTLEGGEFDLHTLFCDRVQFYQDSDLSWGHAVAQADLDLN